MDLETALSASVQLDRRERILRGALLRRRAELRKSWKHLISSECLESLGTIASEVESFLSGQGSIHDWRPAAPFTWINCDASFLDCLRAISLARKVEYPPSDTSPARLSPPELDKLSNHERLKTLSV